MKRIFLSLPMSGRKNEDIQTQIVEMKNDILTCDLFKGEEIQFTDNSKDAVPDKFIAAASSPSLLYLGDAISKMAFCDVAYFGRGWTEARGCLIEREVAARYGIKIVTRLRDGSLSMF